MTDAERLASLLWPEVFNRPFHDVARAQRAIDAGWTPPPDPADVVAMWLTGRPHPAEEFLARLRDLFTADALKAAAAKVQEAQS